MDETKPPTSSWLSLQYPTVNDVHHKHVKLEPGFGDASTSSTMSPVDNDANTGPVKLVQYRCSACLYSSSTSSDTTAHMAVHEDTPFTIITSTTATLYTCETPDCGYTAKTLAVLRGHAKKRLHSTTALRHKCPDWAYLYHKDAELFAHQRISHVLVELDDCQKTDMAALARQYMCEVADCTFASKTRRGLRRHTTIRHDRSLECERCKRKFNTKTTLHQHETRKYLCESFESTKVVKELLKTSTSLSYTPSHQYSEKREAM